MGICETRRTSALCSHRTAFAYPELTAWEATGMAAGGTVAYTPWRRRCRCAIVRGFSANWTELPRFDRVGVADDSLGDDGKRQFAREDLP